MTGSTGSNTYALAYIQTYNGGYVNLDGYYLSNSSLGGYNGFVLANDNSDNPSYLTVKKTVNSRILQCSQVVLW